MKTLNRVSGTLVQGAVHRLVDNQDFQIFVTYLKENLTSTDEDNRLMKDVDLYRSQGKALTLKAILDLLEERSTKTR